ncbi:type II toxin-antitoxin system prevent-host-death family antitoxin [[Mycobacterium] kokjensenii]|uniref:Antitoxin n=1 Tax=[Mycobacterium] kokjensenii TaxID=3064287 RepID=A0ABN9MQE4_9MYCO|nr:type II toxin-antitoxin system prevent-host-death family antitoxin [Mycolicibacter sp. MU0083]CAJ1493000.1 type II toxin-antitoxin system prevent-host-death family antitoxin [Mycolicibacter sp. MU0083]
MEWITSTDAKNQLNRLLNEVTAGASFIITKHGRPVAQLVPAEAGPRRFGQLPGLVVPENFDDALPESELAVWEVADA